MWALQDIAAVKGWDLDETARWVKERKPSPGSLAYNDFFRKEHSDIPNIGNAVTFIDGHGKADMDHVRDLYPVLEAIEDRADQEMVIMAGRVSAETYLAKALN